MATDLATLWQAIVDAGGREAYIQQQLRERGFLVERRSASEVQGLSEAERSRYKQKLKDEAAERKKVASEVWKAYKAKHIVHLGEGVYWCDEDDLDFFDLPDAEERAAENGVPKLDSPKDLAEALGLTIGQLRWLAYHRDAATRVHYRRFFIPKKDGTKRAIWAPMKRLKAVQRWILREIVERLPVHGAVHGFLAGRSTLTNAEMHTRSEIVVEIDLKDFFPTVTLARVKGVFRKAGYREQVATLLALLCTEAPREVVERDGKTWYLALGPRCLPQGAPTSPALTNALCLRLDRRLSGLARKLGWRYSRYADDLTFSLPLGFQGKSRVGLLIGGVGRIAAAEGFKVHPDKTHVARTGSRQRVTGLVVNGEGAPRVPRKLRRQLRAAIHNAEQGKALRSGESLETLAGLASYVHLASPEEGRKLLEQVSGLRKTVAAEPASR